MIDFKEICKDDPYLIFKDLYDQSYGLNQANIEAICISSYSKENKEINSRFVNLKFVSNEEFFFFTNYNSSKGKEFSSHDQISAVIYWNKLNVQIRMKAKIKKTRRDFNQSYFETRDKNKNALAISSNQSNEINSYQDVKDNYHRALQEGNLKKCPKYWGGYSFTPYEIEFWEGNEFRLNKRNLYIKDNNTWTHFMLEP